MIGTLNAVAQSWWSWMGAMLWQVSLLILIVTALDFVLRRWAWPQVRYALWLLVLVKLIIPPTWTLPSSLISRWQPLAQVRIEELLDTARQAPQGTASLRMPPSIPASMTASLASGEPAERPGQTQPSGPPSFPAPAKLGWKALAMLVWVLGMGLFVALLAHRIARLRRWHKQQVEKKAIPVWYYELLVETTKRLGLGRLPAIVFSKDAKAPAVYGMFRPVLLLPASYLDSLSREDAEHVLLHELAHLKRGDLWLHGLCLLLQIVYWFNPLLIWARRQMKHVREICCDLTIAGVLKEKTMKYRDTLINTARELLTETAEPGMGLLGVFEDPFRLVSRLRWLEKKTWRNRKLMAAAVALVTMVMTAAVLPMGKTGQEPVSAAAKQQAEFEKTQAARIENLRFDVEVKTTQPLYAAGLTMIGGLDEFEQAHDRLKKLLNEAGIRPEGFPFGRFISNSSDISLEEYVWEIGYPVAPGTIVEPPLELIRISGQQVAGATIEGIVTNDEVWLKFTEAVKGRGLIPAGPPVLEIWKGEAEGKDFWWKTEMQIPAFSLDEGYPGMEISFKETEPFTALVLPMQGSFSQLAEGAELLKKYVADKGYRTTGSPFSMYFTDASKVPPSQYRWEIGYPVEGKPQVNVPFVIKNVEGAKVASTTFPGPPEPDYPWAPFILQILIKGYIPSLPAIEIWHGDPAKTGTEGPRIELQIPVMSYEDLAEASDEIERSVREAVGGGKSKNEFTLKKLGPAPEMPLGEISPDGRHITFVDWNTGDLAMRDLSTGEDRHLTNEGIFGYVAQAFHSRWSPDGKKIAYDWWDWGQEPAYVGVRVIGLDGQSPRTVYQVPGNQLTQTYAWSKDGEKILVLQSQGRAPDKKTGRITMVSVKDGSAEFLKILDLSRVAYNQGIGMDLSPDGRFVAYDVPVDGNAYNKDILLLSAESREEAPLVEHPANDSLIGFTPDGGHLLFTSNRRGSTDLWSIPVSNGRAAGAPALLVEGIGGIGALGLTHAGAFYYVSGGRAEQSVYIAELDPETGNVVKVPREPVPYLGRVSHSPAYSPDGRKLAYVSDQGSWGEVPSVIRIRSLDSGKERELFPEYNFRGFEWSADGRTLLGRGVDGRDRSARIFLGTIDVETGEVRVIKKCDLPRMDKWITGSSWSKDGRSVFYVQNTKPEKLCQLFVLDLESGSEKELYRAPTWAERFNISRSPDGKWLALMNYKGMENKTRTLRVVSADGKEARSLTSFEDMGNGLAWTMWTPDGKYILYPKNNPREAGMDQLWRIPFAGGKPEKLDIEMVDFFHLSVSPDGSRLAFTSSGPSEKEPELWVMENFLPKKTVF